MIMWGISGGDKDGEAHSLTHSLSEIWSDICFKIQFDVWSEIWLDLHVDLIWLNINISFSTDLASTFWCSTNHKRNSMQWVATSLHCNALVWWLIGTIWSLYMDQIKIYSHWPLARVFDFSPWCSILSAYSCPSVYQWSARTSLILADVKGFVATAPSLR